MAAFNVRGGDGRQGGDTVELGSFNVGYDDLRPSRAIAVLGTFNGRDGDVCQGADVVAPGSFHV